MGFFGCCRNLRRNVPPILAFFALLLVASASAATYTRLDRRARWQWHFGIERRMSRKLEEEQRVSSSARRRLAGPGSSPPSCRSKCGKCSPCEPVHVPVHPGLSEPLEYYPEAWRCKCGNKLFMP